MIVDLKKDYTGKEIIEAFEKAGTFEESNERIWRARKIIIKEKYVQGSNGKEGDIVPHEVNVSIRPHHLGMLSSLFSKNKPKKKLNWRRKNYLTIKFNPALVLDQKYDELDINVVYWIDNTCREEDTEAMRHKLPREIMKTITDRFLTILKENESKS